jgi:hypothetical protein
MDRHRVFTVGSVLLVVLLAGCSAAGSLEMQSTADDVELAEQFSRPTAVSGDEPVDHRQIARRAIENGSTTARSRDPLIEPGLPFAAEGRYYDVSSTVVGRQPGTAVTLEIDYNGTVRDNETVGYSNLSARDRALVDGVLPPKIPPRTDGYDFGTSRTYNETELNRSVLLTAAYDAVRYEGETYPINVRDTRSVTIRTYRYTASMVADSSAVYANELREEYLFTLSGLSEGERTVVEAAINDTYYAESTDDAQFRSVLETVRQHDAVQRNEYRGRWLVRYEGVVYVASLSYERFDV